MSQIDPGILASLAQANAGQPATNPVLSSDSDAEARRGIHRPHEQMQPPGSTGTHPMAGRGSVASQSLPDRNTLDRSALEDAQGSMNDTDYKMAHDYANSPGATQQGLSSMVEKGISRKDQQDRIAKEQQEKYGTANTGGLTGQTGGATPGGGWNTVVGRGIPGEQGYSESVSHFGPADTSAQQQPQGSGKVPDGVDPQLFKQLPIAQQAEMQMRDAQNKQSMGGKQKAEAAKGITTEIAGYSRDLRAATARIKEYKDNFNPSESDTAQHEKDLQSVEDLSNKIDDANGRLSKSYEEAAPQPASAATQPGPVSMATPAQTMMQRLAYHAKAQPIVPGTKFAMGQMYKSPHGRVHQMVGQDEKGQPLFSQPLA